MPARTARGQATVEVALVLPLLALLALLVVQVGVLARDRVAVTHAARAGARAAAVDPSPREVRAAVVRATHLDADRIEVTVSGAAGPGSLVTVHVTYRDPTDVALVGPLVPDVSLEETLVARLE